MHPPARHSSRLGQRLQVTLGAAAALATISLSPGSAQAYVVTLGGVQYDVTTFTGTYNDNISKFKTAANGGVMPWWNNRTLAMSFATAVGTNLGYPNFGVAGPFFGYQFETIDPCADANPEEGGSCPSEQVRSIYRSNNGAYITNDSFADNSRTWAQASLYTAPAPAPVPGPLPLFGAAAAFGFSRKLRKRIKLAPAALGSSLPQA